MAQIQVQHQSPVSAPPNGVAQPAPNNANQFVTTSLYVGDLDVNVNDSQLYDLFNQVGQVVSVRVCRDLTTRRSLGYGYVNFSNPQDAARALDVLNFTPLNNKSIRIMYSHRDPSIRKSGTANIFIKNLDKAIDHKALHDTFSSFGHILSCKIATDGSGLSKGQNFMPPFMQPQPLHATPPFMNGPNHNNNHFPLQNNHLLGQPHMGVLGPQNGVVGNANYNNPMFHVQGQVLQNAAQLNFSQQVLAQSIMNMLQQQPNINMNMGMPNGQFCGPYPMQNMNQQLPMQMPNPSQGVPYGMNPGSCTPMFGFPNQVPQGMVPQKSMFFANSQLGIVPGNQVRPQINPNEKNVAPSNVNTNAFPSQQFQGNSSGSFNPNLAQTSSPQPPAFMKSHLQENPNSNIKTNVSQSNWKGSPSKNFKNKPNRRGFQGGFQKSKFHDVNNGKRRFGKEHNGKGPNSGRAGQDGFKSKELKQQLGRSLHVTYTEQEIQQWREARKKNHPFSNNIQKKHSEHQKDSKAINREVLQRELKEVLAKQAELGVEVAEIPSYYLKNSENQGLQNEQRNKFTDKRNFQNKFRKPTKKRKFADKDFSESPSVKKRKPTLLQKLLSADIKRDKSHLLQVFRFMAMNSFFKHCPDKPLCYSSVIVKENDTEVDGEDKYLHSGKDVLKRRNAESVQKTVNLNNNNGHDSEVEDSEDDENDPIVDNDPHKEPSSLVKRKCDSGEGIVKSDEEEGEIIE